MFDLDHFKRYSDNQRHDAGDALLGAFGAALAQSCRGEDIACRFGGEEFTLVLTDAGHARALERAEAIRKSTAELVVRYRNGALASGHGFDRRRELSGARHHRRVVAAHGRPGAVPRQARGTQCRRVR